MKYLALFLLLPSIALATGSKDTQEQDQAQAQDQSQAQAQDQSQSQTANNEGNTQSVEFEASANSAIAPNVFATSPCTVGGSGALGLKGVNIGGGKSTVDPECVRREEARLLNALGERELAVIHLCNSPGLAASLGDKCAPTTTQAELRERIKLLLEEREIDRQTCKESKDRIAEACRK